MQYYLITDPRFYPPTPREFSLALSKAFATYAPQYACLRGYGADSRALSFIFVEQCRAFGVRAFMSGDVDIAMEFGYEGVHLKSHQLRLCERLKEHNLKSFYSAHSLLDLHTASKLGIDAATISPIFPTPDKSAPLGVEFLSTIPYEELSCEVFALGGIVSAQEVALLEAFALSGFASIRYFCAC